jgi:hypothetical protein
MEDPNEKPQEVLFCRSELAASHDRYHKFKPDDCTGIAGSKEDW